MGGRGSKGKAKNYNAKKMSESEFLAKKGLDSPISDYLNDKLRGNRNLRTQKGQEKFEKETQKAINEYSQKRKAAIEEYNKLVKQGKIKPKSKTDELLDRARGHSDNPSVLAARRILAKKNIDWKTGKSLNGKGYQPSLF